VFGCIKTAQVRQWIRWWHLFSSDLGSHVFAEQLFQCGKRCAYVEEYEGFSSEQLTNILNGDLCCGFRFHCMITTQVCVETISGTWSTTFGHVWLWEGPGDEVILASVCNWTQRYRHETMSRSMFFVVGMISGRFVSWESFLFRWMCSLLQLPILAKGMLITSPLHRLSSCMLMLGLHGHHGGGEGDVAQPNQYTDLSMIHWGIHTQSGRNAFGPVLLKWHLLHNPYVAWLWYNIIPHLIHVTPLRVTSNKYGPMI